MGDVIFGLKHVSITHDGKYWQDLQVPCRANI